MALTLDQKVQFDVNMPTVLTSIELDDDNVELIMAYCRCAFWEGYLCAQREIAGGDNGTFARSVGI